MDVSINSGMFTLSLLNCPKLTVDQLYGDYSGLGETINIL